MGTGSIIRRAVPWLVRREQSLLEPLEGTNASLRVGEKTKTAIPPLVKPQKESGKWHGSVSYVRRLFGRRASKSLGPESHSGSTQNIALDSGASPDGGGNSSSLPTSSPQVPVLSTPKPMGPDQSLHLNLDEDSVAHRREMKIAALEQAQIQEELWEAARLRGGCVPCSKGTVTVAPRQSSAPGLSIRGEERAPESRGEKSRPEPQPDPAPPRPEAGSRTSQEPKPTPAIPPSRQRRLAIQGKGPSPSGQPPPLGTQSSATPQTDLGSAEGNALHDPGSH